MHWVLQGINCALLLYNNNNNNDDDDDDGNNNYINNNNMNEWIYYAIDNSLSASGQQDEQLKYHSQRF